MSKIPSATWSVSELGLDRPHEPVSEAELCRLARLALLDVHRLDQTALRQNLGNMLHMMEQVRGYRGGDHLTEEQLYDVPRGVTTAPLRDDHEYIDQGATGNVWNSLLQPKTTHVGAHSYFAVTTKVETKKD